LRRISTSKDWKIVREKKSVVKDRWGEGAKGFLRRGGGNLKKRGVSEKSGTQNSLQGPNWGLKAQLGKSE